MSQGPDGSRESLTGLWQGQFSYPRRFNPEFFTATLLETPDWLSGSTQEVSTFGKSAGKTLYATISGQRHANTVNFLKTYESVTRTHQVKYTGVISGDQMEIEGTWLVSGQWAGKFLMIRSTGIAQAIRKMAMEPV